jgi:agmatine/peptidylarginine deiminase
MLSAKHSFYLLTVLILVMIPGFLPGHVDLPTDTVFAPSRFTETNPPQGPVRPVAEFEPASHVLIRYPLGFPVSLVVQLASQDQVICLVSSQSQQNQATSTFNSAGANMANISFMIAATDSYWTRDYAPWFIFDGNDEYGVVDFIYNRPRPNDNLIPQLFANQYNHNYYGMNLQQTGGNYMTDGICTAAQTTIAYTENGGYTQAQVNAKMHDYMGISSYHVLPDPNNTYIDHIDCWGKFLAPDKVLIRSVPTSHPQYSEIEQTATYFTNLNCAWGYPFRVYRVNTPQNQPYSNSLILNKRVFVPIMNSNYDAAALQVYRDALPGYEVIGVPGSNYTPWESTDALHCRTHEIPDKQMIHISHQPWWGIKAYATGYDINATIKAHSGQALYPDSTFVCYKVNQQPWQRSALINIVASEYTALLNGFAPGDTIRYFIHTADLSGRSLDHPFTAAFDPHVFIIEADTEPPLLNHIPPAEMTNQATLFTVTASDNCQVGQVLMQYKVDEQEIPIELALNPNPQAGPDAWSCLVEPQFSSEDETFHYRFIAQDLATPPNIGYYPPSGTWISLPIIELGNEDNHVPESIRTGLRVYPNPLRKSSGNYFTIDFTSSGKSPFTLKIFNLKGQLLSTKTISPSTQSSNLISWPFSDFGRRNAAPGLYFCKITQDGNSFISKMLIMD